MKRARGGIAQRPELEDAIAVVTCDEVAHGSREMGRRAERAISKGDKGRRVGGESRQKGRRGSVRNRPEMDETIRARRSKDGAVRREREVVNGLSIIYINTLLKHFTPGP